MHRVDLELDKITFPSPPTPHPTPKQSESLPESMADVTPTAGLPATSPHNETEASAPPKKLTVEVSGDPVGGLHTEFKSTVAHIYVRWHGHGLRNIYERVHDLGASLKLESAPGAGTRLEAVFPYTR